MGVRSLSGATLEGCQRINILSGQNGSGKTSVLEAIYLLGMGRSFRSSQQTSVINHQMNECTVYGELSFENGAREKTLGAKRSRSGRHEFHVNKQCVGSAAMLARELPLQLINNRSFELIEGGPKIRRQFVDWGVFHVKPSFIDSWRSFQRGLRQRNHLLRAHNSMRRGRIYPSEIAAWDTELARAAAEIDALRGRYVDDVRPVFNDILERFIRLPDVSLCYERGWQPDLGLADALVKGFERDAAMGATTTGPHRANIDIRVGGRPAMDVLSRGQQKLVVASLKLAQGQLLAAQQARACVYLIDDLPAELDNEHQAIFCQLLDEMGSQAFITGVDTQSIEGYWTDPRSVQRFHVKQGVVEQKH